MPKEFVIVADEKYEIDSPEGVQKAQQAMIAAQQSEARIWLSSDTPSEPEAQLTGQKLTVGLTAPEEAPVSTEPAPEDVEAKTELVTDEGAAAAATETETSERSVTPDTLPPPADPDPNAPVDVPSAAEAPTETEHKTE